MIRLAPKYVNFENCSAVPPTNEAAQEVMVEEVTFVWIVYILHPPDDSLLRA